MRHLPTILLFVATVANVARTSALPSYAARRRARSAKMPGIRLIDGDVKMGSYIVSFLSTSLAVVTLMLVLGQNEILSEPHSPCTVGK